MIRGVIFDVDGVLLDSMSVWDDLGQRYLTIKGKEARPGLREILFPMSMEQAADYLIKEYQLSGTTSQIVEEINRMIRQFYEETVQLKPGVLEYLVGFRKLGIPMVIATSGGKQNITAAFQRLQVLGYFEKIITCSEIGAGKEKPEIYLKAAEQLGSSPDETVVFEDACHALLTAKQAGFYTVAVYDQANEKDREKLKKQADYFLERFPDFSSFLKQIQKN